MTIEAITETATKVLTQHGFHVLTILFDGTHGSDWVVVPEFPSESIERAQFLYQLGRKAVREHSVGILQQVFLVSEGWMSKLSIEGSSKKRYVRPSLDPHRVEVLTITCFNPSTEESIIRMLEVIRNSKEEIVELKKVEFGDGKGQDNLLPAFVAGYQNM